MTNTDKLGTDRIRKLLVKFAVPSIFSLVLHAFYNIVDRMFIGRYVGEMGLAGVSICFPVLLLLFGFCLLFGSGGAALISIKLGEKRKDEAELVLGNIFSLTTVMGILFTTVGLYFCKDILLLYSASDITMPHAYTYLSRIFSGSIFFFYGFAMTIVIRSEGNPIYSTAMIVFATLANAFLDYIFIVKMSMGTEGAALATIIAEAIVVLMGFYYFAKSQGVLHIRAKNLIVNFKIAKKITTLGLSPALMNMAASIQMTLLNAQLMFFSGETAVAAMGITFSVASIIMLFTFGMAAGMQPIVGYNYGAELFARVKRTFIGALIGTFIVSIVYVVIVEIYAESIAGIFCDAYSPLIQDAAYTMRIYLSLMPLATAVVLGARYHQAIGKGWSATLIGLSRQVIIFVPVLFILSRTHGLNGVLFSGPVTELVAFLIIGFILLRKGLVLEKTRNRTV